MLNNQQFRLLLDSLTVGNAILRTPAGEPYQAPTEDNQVSVSFMGSEQYDTNAIGAKGMESTYAIQVAVRIGSKLGTDLELQLHTLMTGVFQGLQAFERLTGLPVNIQLSTTYEDNTEYRTADMQVTFRHWVGV